MIFASDINGNNADAGILKGRQIEVACFCWFTSTGVPIPRSLKLKDEDGIVKPVRIERIIEQDKKYYSGILSVEYKCEIQLNELLHVVKLIFFVEKCRWILCLQ